MGGCSVDKDASVYVTAAVKNEAEPEGEALVLQFNLHSDSLSTVMSFG